MNTFPVKQFFNNKVSIKLKNGHCFQGLLSSVNYKDQSIILSDVEDRGNQADENCIPHDKKIAEKAFEAENIEEIFFNEKHFCQPKKYKKTDFFDQVSEASSFKPKYKQKTSKNERPYYKKAYENKDSRQERDYHYKDNRDNKREQRENRGGYRKKESNYSKSNYKNENQKEEMHKDNRKWVQNPKNQKDTDRDYR